MRLMILRLMPIVMGIIISLESGTSQEILEAIRTNDNERVKELVMKDPGLVKAKSNRGETALHGAALKGNKEMTSFLLSEGAEVNIRDAANNTPLTNAIRSKSLETVKILVENGADVNLRGLWEFLPIQVAAEFTTAETVNYLIDKGCLVPAGQDQDAYQLLHAACKKGFTKLFEKMLGNGFDLKMNSYTRNLLHEAASGGSVSIIEILLSKGYKVMSGDGYGWSPLHCAAENGNLDAVRLLSDKGADVNDRSASGKTPYNLARFFGHSEVCEFLASGGADTSAQKFLVLQGRYAGQKEPDSIPRPFGIDFITTKYMVHGNVTFTPDGNEAYWSPFMPSPGSSDEKGRILMMGYRNGCWSKPEMASFSVIGFDDDSPFVTPDGKRLFFISRRPLEPGGTKALKENIWFMTRAGDSWSNPEPLSSVNSLDMHWQVSTDEKGNLFFGARDPEGTRFGEIFCSKYVDGRYLEPVRLGAGVNSENIDGSPFISPDGDYLIFDRASRFGQQMGLYISFLDKQGEWTEAKPIAPVAGLSPAAQNGRISPDGKYLFYIAGYTGEFGVYWVKADFIRRMKEELTGR